MAPAITQDRYKLVFFVPAANAQKVKYAVFATGAGTIGLYDKTCFVISGVGEFVPAADATPHIGAPGKPEKVEELRIETQCTGQEMVRNAIEAIKA